MTPNWPALRQLWRPCAIGIGIWTAFLAIWQFLVPGKESDSSSLEAWLLIVALAVLVPTSLVLTNAATGRLWRAWRLALLVPTALICGLTWALPSLALEAGLEWSIAFWMVPVALLLSSIASALFVLYTPSPAIPRSAAPVTLARFAMPAQACGVILILAATWRGRMHTPASIWSWWHLYLLVSAIFLGAWCAIDLIRGNLTLQPYRQARTHWPQLAAVALRVLVWLLIAVAAHMAMPDETFRFASESTTKSWVAATVLMLVALLPRQRRWAPGDVLFGVLLVLVGSDLARTLDEHVENTLDIVSPFERTSYVRNGGGSALVNEHAARPGGAWAVDLYLPTSSGAICAGEGLSAFPCFGAPVLAPVGGRVVRVVNDRPDLLLGDEDWEVPAGNSISIQTQDGRYLVLGHLRQSTISVEEGEHVTAGQKIARCGNSGAAGWPHLLLQARDRPDAWNGDARDQTFPLRFIDTLRIRGKSVTEGPFVVRRNDLILPHLVDDEE